MDGPHQGARRATAGPGPADAEAAVVLVHGRGATAESILEFAREFSADGVTYVAPQAARNTWYPNSFLAPTESNQPGLSSGLSLLETIVDELTDAGIPRERIAFVGFSQGACLASEFVAHNPTRYGGLAALSGGVIGPDVSVEEYADNGSLDGTPVFVGCSDSDPHIPLERVQETTAVLEALDANVTERIYPGMGHGVNQEELDHVAEMVRLLVEGEN